MRFVALFSFAVVALPAVAWTQRVPGYRRPEYPPDFQKWDQPLEGSTAEAEVQELVTYGNIEAGKETSGSLVANETHYLQFRLAALSHCMLETADVQTDLQIAYLDDATKVAALGLYAELKAGVYFVRLRSRNPAKYKLTLQCSAQ